MSGNAKTAASDVLIARQFIGRPGGLQRGGVRPFTPDAENFSGLERLSSSLERFGVSLSRAGDAYQEKQEKDAQDEVDKFLADKDPILAHQILDKYGVTFQDNPLAMRYLKKRVTETALSGARQQFSANMQNEADGYGFNGDDGAMVSRYNADIQEALKNAGLDPADEEVLGTMGKSHVETIQKLSQTNQSLRSGKLVKMLHETESGKLIGGLDGDLMRTYPDAGFDKFQQGLMESIKGGAFNSTERFMDVMNQVAARASVEGASDFIRKLGDVKDPHTGQTFADLAGAKFDQQRIAADNRAPAYGVMKDAEFYRDLSRAVETGDPRAVYALHDKVQPDSPAYERWNPAFKSALAQVEQVRLRKEHEAARLALQQGAEDWEGKAGDELFRRVKEGLTLSNDELPTNPFTQKQMSKKEAKEHVLSRFQQYAAKVYSSSDNPDEAARHLMGLAGQANGWLDDWVQDHARNGFTSVMNSFRDARSNPNFKFNEQVSNALSMYKAARETGGLHLTHYKDDERNVMEYILDRQRVGATDKEIASMLENRQERLRVEPDFARTAYKSVAKTLDGKKMGYWDKFFSEPGTTSGGKFFGNVVMHSPHFKEEVTQIAVDRALMSGRKPEDHIDEAVEIATKQNAWVNGFPISKGVFQKYDPKGKKQHMNEDATAVVRDAFGPEMERFGLKTDEMTLRLTPDGRHVVATHPLLAAGVHPTGGRMPSISVEELNARMNLRNEARIMEQRLEHERDLELIRKGREWTRGDLMNEATRSRNWTRWASPMSSLFGPEETQGLMDSLFSKQVGRVREWSEKDDNRTPYPGYQTGDKPED